MIDKHTRIHQKMVEMVEMMEIAKMGFHTKSFFEAKKILLVKCNHHINV